MKDNNYQMLTWLTQSRKARTADLRGRSSKPFTWLCGLILCLLATLYCFLPGQAILANGQLSEPLSLTVRLRQAPPDTEGKLYKLADFDPETGVLTLTTEFQALTDLNTLLQTPPRVLDSPEEKAAYAKKLQDQGQTILGLIAKNSIPPYQTAKSQTNPAGESFLRYPVAGQSLQPGLYLVDVAPYETKTKQYLPQIMMVTLPTHDPQNWQNFLSALTIEAKLEEKNKPQELELKVIKLWETEDGRVLNSMEQMSEENRQGLTAHYPDEITAALYQDGKLYKTAILSASNHWQFTFTKLPEGHRYVVSEEKVPAGYSLTVTNEDGTFVLHNRQKPETPPPPTEKPSRPPKETKPTIPPQIDKPLPGDGLPFTAVLWWPVYLLVATALLCICVGLLRRRHQQ